MQHLRQNEQEEDGIRGHSNQPSVYIYSNYNCTYIVSVYYIRVAAASILLPCVFVCVACFSCALLILYVHYYIFCEFLLKQYNAYGG
jgi:hypothetical protein